MRLGCLILMLVTGSLHAQTVGGTAVPKAQIPAVIRDVAEWHDLQHPDCPFRKATGSRTVEKRAGGTVEHWSVEACEGKAFAYQVDVFPGEGGGVTEMVSNIGGTPIRDTPKLSDEELAAQCKAMRREHRELGDPDKLDDNKAMRYYALAASLAMCDLQESLP